MTAGTSLFAGGGGVFQTTQTNNPLANLQQGMFQVTANRALFTNLRNASGTEIATAGNPLRIDPTGMTTQPVSIASLPSLAAGSATIGAVTQASGPWSTNVTQFGGAAIATGTGSSGAGVPRVTVSSDSVVGRSGTLPAFAATPTFNLGTLNGAATAANQTSVIGPLAAGAAATHPPPPRGGSNPPPPP